MNDSTPSGSTNFARGLFPATTATRIWATAGVCLPLLLVFAVCIRYLSPVPVTDDYDAILRMLHAVHQQAGFFAKAARVIFWQHNEYKPIYASVVIALQQSIAGRSNMVVLSLIGDGQLLLLAWLLWKNFAPDTIPALQRMALFVPVSLLAFQLNYGETLNWAMPCLQNIGVVVFALLTMACIVRPGRGWFAVACAALALTIAASGNGFFLVPVGALYLWQTGRRARIAAWCATAAACAAIYFHGYVRPAPAPPAPGATHHAWAALPFVLSFLGSAGAIKLSLLRYVSVPLGLAVCGAVWMAVRQRFHRTNPAIAYFALFILITSLGVSAIRGGQGYDQSLSGRYKIYSDMLLVCIYCAGLQLWSDRPVDQRRTAFRLSLAFASIIFLMGMGNGARWMGQRYNSITAGMRLYTTSGGTAGPVIALPAEDPNAIEGNNARLRAILRNAEADGIYTVP